MLNSTSKCLRRLHSYSKAIFSGSKTLQTRLSSNAETIENEPSQDITYIAESRFVPKTRDEARQLSNQKPVSPMNSKVLTVAVVGLPNAGKSTLINKLMEWRVCSASKKVHTTRKNTRAVYMDGNTQVVFVDTPGLICKGEKDRFQLTEQMLNDPAQSFKSADVVLMLYDVNNRYERLRINPKVFRILAANPDVPTFLVLNKIDRVQSKPFLIDVVNSLTEGYLNNKLACMLHPTKKQSKPKSGKQIIKETFAKLQQRSEITHVDDNTPDHDLPNCWRLFREVFMISALHNDGVADLRKRLLEFAKQGDWQYPTAFVTDQDPRDIIIATIREKLLDHPALVKAIPYMIKINLAEYDYLDTGSLSVTANLTCPQSNLVKIVIGDSGKTVATIAEEAKQDLMNTFRCPVILKLVVQDKKIEKK